MTAELALLNKTNIVLAADSAVTIGLHRKVFNTANKLFPLSNYEPIGIMIYNNAEWMDIPLEIIIKSYTKQLGEKSFKYLEDYKIDFINYLKNNFKKFINDEQIENIIVNRLYSVLDSITDYLEEDFNNILDESSDSVNISELKEKTLFDIVDELSNYKDDILPEFIDYKFETFKLEYKKIIDQILPGFFQSIKVKKTLKLTSRIYKCLYHELICKFSELEDYSGIVIAGYGTDEIFPSIADLKIGEIISDKLRYETEEASCIDNKMTALICPFAQRDMIDTFVNGINPNYYEDIQDVLLEEILSISENILKLDNNLIKENIDKILSELIPKVLKKISKVSFDKHTKYIVRSVSHLRKDDLIELAENLINLTSIKRKTSSEIQSVGGPIDIALITKHEGFIWIKRKESIQKDINSAFFNREFKNMKNNF